MRNLTGTIKVFLISFLVLVNTNTCIKSTETNTGNESFYVGTYTNEKSQGIYKCVLLTNGKIDSIGLAAKVKNPSYLTKSIDKKHLLAVSENENGMLLSFKIDTNDLELINQENSGGANPCFVSTNTNNYILTANYTSGSVGLLKIGSNGKLSNLLDRQNNFGRGKTERQKSSHAHSAWFEPKSNTVITVDLGTDELLFYSIDFKSEKLIPSHQKTLKLNAGAGPRHIAFHPSKDWFYVINELNSTVSLVKKNYGIYYLDSSFSTLPESFTDKNNCADIHISNDGKFLYASNRGHNSIVIFSIKANGKLKLLDHKSTSGNWPRNFTLSPNNNFLLVANQHSNSIVSFKRDAETGLLEYVAKVKVPSPACILF